MSFVNMYSSRMSSKHFEIVLNNCFHESFVLKIDLQLGSSLNGKNLQRKICTDLRLNWREFDLSGSKVLRKKTELNVWTKEQPRNTKTVSVSELAGKGVSVWMSPENPWGKQEGGPWARQGGDFYSFPQPCRFLSLLSLKGTAHIKEIRTEAL